MVFEGKSLKKACIYNCNVTGTLNRYIVLSAFSMVKFQEPQQETPEEALAYQFELIAIQLPTTWKQYITAFEH